MSYRSTDNTERIVSEKSNKVSLLLRVALEAIHKEADPNTPKLEGLLRANVRKNVVGKRGSIRWGQKYAAYQERGYTSGKVRRYTTPGTGAHFAEKAVKKVDKERDKYFRMVGL